MQRTVFPAKKTLVECTIKILKKDRKKSYQVTCTIHHARKSFTNYQDQHINETTVLKVCYTSCWLCKRFSLGRWRGDGRAGIRQLSCTRGRRCTSRRLSEHPPTSPTRLSNRPPLPPAASRPQGDRGEHVLLQKYPVIGRSDCRKLTFHENQSCVFIVCLCVVCELGKWATFFIIIMLFM